MPEDALIAEVQALLRRADTILFIGSGLSRWAELPTWEQLLREMADRVEEKGGPADAMRSEIAAGNYLLAADYGCHFLHPADFSQFIRWACQVNKAEPRAIHQQVVTLGPTCFITTNYDQLLEDAYRDAHNRCKLQPVKNNDLINLPGIQEARSQAFIFKLHGDVNDPESIILSRSQYRALHGKKAAALDALRLFLMSRPLLFIGFGMRDPDFLYVTDQLLNIYQGSPKEHYAILPDMAPVVRAFWREQYGFKLLTYETVAGTDGSRDHSALLQLLRDLKPAPLAAAPSAALSEAEFGLALIHYTARFGRNALPEGEAPLALQVGYRADERPAAGDAAPPAAHAAAAFNQAPVERLLANFPDHLLLLGLPGAGKSFALQRYRDRLAKELADAIAQRRSEEPPVPIYIDLKLYDGDLLAMIERQLPAELSLTALLSRRRVHLLLDSFNEMERRYREDGTWERDFAAFRQRPGEMRLLIGSRTNEGLQGLGWPAFELAEIDEKSVKEYVAREGVRLLDAWRDHVLQLLRKPLFFDLYRKGAIRLGEGGPGQMYQSYLEQLAQRWAKERQAPAPDLAAQLAPLAYAMLNDGQETMAPEQAEARLEPALRNWLIEQRLLLALPGPRLAFFHQSVTEYLAAYQLALEYRQKPDALRERLRYTRWDQALFLTLAFLAPAERDEFLDLVLRTDFDLAGRTVQFVEAGRDELASQVLQFVLEHPADGSFWGVKDLPLTAAHLPLLREVMKSDSILSGVVAARYLDLTGEAGTAEAIDALVAHRDDGIYCYNLATALRPLLQSADWTTIAERLGAALLAAGDDGSRGLPAGLRALIDNRIKPALLPHFAAWRTALPTHFELLAAYVAPPAPPAPPPSISELLTACKAGDDTALWSLNRRIAYHSFDETAAPLFDGDLVERLLVFLHWADKAVQQYSAHLLRRIAALRPDLSAPMQRAAATAESPALQTVLYFYAGDDERGWAALDRLSNREVAPSEERDLHLIKRLNLDWTGRTELLWRLLRQGNLALMARLLEQVQQHESAEWADATLDRLADEPAWWLARLASDAEAEELREAIGISIGKSATPALQQRLLSLLQQPDCPYRRAIAVYILPWARWLVGQPLTTETREFLIEVLLTERISIEWYLICAAASDEFIQSHLLPRLQRADKATRAKLKKIIELAGEHLGIRYFVPER